MLHGMLLQAGSMATPDAEPLASSTDWMPIIAGLCLMLASVLLFWFIQALNRWFYRRMRQGHKIQAREGRGIASASCCGEDLIRPA